MLFLRNIVCEEKRKWIAHSFQEPGIAVELGIDVLQNCRRLSDMYRNLLKVMK